MMTLSADLVWMGDTSLIPYGEDSSTAGSWT